VLPKHWWEGTDKAGNKRDVTATTLEPPLGCGAYRLKEFVPGRTVIFERVADYWGKDVSVNIGRDNFNEMRYEYFRDSTVALEAFKADAVDWRTENSAKNWATAYDFPAVKDKRVLLEEFPILSSGGMQAYAFNIRRPKFADPRVRRAFNLALNFEELNKQIFFGQYKRVNSYFEGMELASSGLPEGAELAILETVRDKVPPEVFTTPYTNPTGGNPDAVRANLREATRLLREAGYEIRNGKLANTKTNEPLAVEVLIDRPEWERIVLPYKPSLERLGIAMTLRTVDDAQYENRLRQWDYDMVVASWGQSLSPGNEQRGFWSSKAADQAGSRNLVGIKNPAVDTLIERLIFAILTRCPNTASRDSQPCGGGIGQKRRRWDRARDRSVAPKRVSDRRRRPCFQCDRIGWPGPASCRRRTSWHLLVRRSEIPHRFSVLRLRQSAGSQRRRVFPDRPGHDLQSEHAHLQFAQ
jgi:microcin C transport system substrate-binding protein